MVTIRASSFKGKPRVGLVLPDYYLVVTGQDAGGAEVQASFIARGLRDAGYSVTVVTHASGQPDEFELDGIRIARIDRRGREMPIIRNIHPRLTCVWHALARADCDVYFQQCAGANTFVTGLYSRLHGRRFVYLGASDPDFDRAQARIKFRRPGGWRDLKFYELGLKLADAIVAQHDGQVVACRQWHGRDARKILNPYLPQPGASSSSDGYVLWVATVKSLKRPDLFLALAHGLPHLNFKMIGGPAPGNEARVFEEIQGAAGKLPNVEFVGFVPFPEVESHFDRARVFVNTSDYEGFPNTFLQSWARGIPTVSFVDCGAREEGRAIGRACRNFEEMKDAVALLCEDDALWAREGERARRYFLGRHTVEKVVNRYAELIDQLAEQGRRG